MITKVSIYGVGDSIVASGYPKCTNVNDAEYSSERANKLSACKIGTGHDCFLKGIIVQADIKAPSYWWHQFQRYHFADIISSQSKMHCLSKFDINESCNRYVLPEIIEIVEKLAGVYNRDKTEENFMRLVSNTPMGFLLTARITTNYLQLKTIYSQRKNHKLIEWRTFCNWIESLPLAAGLNLVDVVLF